MDRRVDTVIKQAIECIKQKKNFLIQGGAGSGKTEALKELLNTISEEFKDKKIVCITHTNTAVDEIKQRTKNQYPVYTIHSFLYSIIGNYRKNIKMVLAEIFKVDSLEKICNTEEKEVIDFAIYKKAYEKYWKKQYKINPGSKTQQIMGKREYDNNSIKYNEELNKKINILNSQIENIIKEECDYTKIKYNQRKFDSIKNFTYGHDSLLKIFNIMVNKFPILLKIINDKYDLILIDEYQDTNKQVINTFINVIGKGETTIGLFGDDMQAIYKEGIGNVEAYVQEGSITKIQKVDNYRCSQQVIQFLNNIRQDLKQEIALIKDETIEERQGSVKLFYKIDNAKPDLKASQEEKQRYVNDLDAFLNDVTNHLNIGNLDYKVLLLSNAALAKKLHFENLYNIFADRSFEVKDDIEEMCTELGWIDATEIYLYFKDKEYKNHNKLIHFLKENDYIIKNQEDKKNIVTILDSINPNEQTIGQVISLFSNNKMYKETETRKLRIALMKRKIEENKVNEPFLKFVENYKTNSTFSKMKEIDNTITQEDFDYYANLIKELTFNEKIIREDIKFSEIINYKKYIDEKFGYLTMHKTKGSSITNVIVILDEYFWTTEYNFEKLIKNQRDSSTYEKTKKLFYVACSRARKDLIMIRIIKSEEEQELLKYFHNDICEVHDWEEIEKQNN